MALPHVRKSVIIALALTHVGTVANAAPGASPHEDLRAEFVRDMEIDYPENNLPNAERADLGRTLFFDPRLSRSGGQSCASCHNPAFAWGDGLAVGVGENLAPLGRRSPSILNLAWAEPLM